MISGHIQKIKKFMQKKSKDDFKNIKSDYFLMKVFGILQQKKSLEITKYNKHLQNRLKLGINDYKAYSQLLSNIEIELKAIYDEKHYNFINIPNEEKKYYHIYIGNSNRETKRNSLNKNESNKPIKIIIDCQVKSFRRLFFYFKCINSINFKKFYRNNITDMTSMFEGCTSLKELDLSNFNTENVTSMNCMFDGCLSLEKLELSKFNTNNVTDMYSMFSVCSKLKKLNLSSFNTDKVTDMRYMFCRCYSLEDLNINNINTKNAKTIDWMAEIPIEFKKKFYRSNPKIFREICSAKEVNKKKKGLSRLYFCLLLNK